MNFKMYLDSLFRCFYSRQNGAEIAGLAAPSEKNTAISLGDGDSVDIVSPSNGFLTVYSPSGNSSRELKIYSVPDNTGVSIGINLESASGGFVFVPVRKGQTMRVWGTGLDLSRCSAKVYEFVGGGAKTLFHLLQKGGRKCLRLRVCLTRFHAARPLLLSKGLTSKTLASRVQQLRLSLHLTDMLLLSRQDTRTRMQSILVAEVCKFLHLATLVRGLSCGFLAERDSTLQSESTEVHRRIRFYGASRLDLSSNALYQEVTYGLA